MPGIYDTYYDNDANNARMREEADRQHQREREQAEDQRRRDAADLAYYTDMANPNNNKYVGGGFTNGPANYSGLAAGAASGLLLGWSIKKIWRGLFGGGR